MEGKVEIKCKLANFITHHPAVKMKQPRAMINIALFFFFFLFFRPAHDGGTQRKILDEIIRPRFLQVNFGLSSVLHIASIYLARSNFFYYVFKYIEVLCNVE